jgi:hypothetical protein
MNLIVENISKVHRRMLSTPITLVNWYVPAHEVSEHLLKKRISVNTAKVITNAKPATVAPM